MEDIVDSDPGDVTVDTITPIVTEEKQPDIMPDPEQPVERPKRGRGRPKKEEVIACDVEDSCRKKYVVQIPGETSLVVEAESQHDALKQYFVEKHIIATDHVPVVHEVAEERSRGGE